MTDILVTICAVAWLISGSALVAVEIQRGIERLRNP